jgi:uncharacterized protein (UPF0248 family)
MPTSTTNKQFKNKLKRERRRNAKQTVVLPPRQVLPYGSSYIDFMPDDIIHTIFKTKHEMEYHSTVQMINKFKYAFDEDNFKTRIPIKQLLKPLTKRKIFHMDVEEYHGAIAFGATEENIKQVEKDFNVKVNLSKPNDPLNAYSYSESYTDVRVKWNDPRHVLVLDIICLTKSLDLNCLSQCYALEALRVEDINRKTDDITFEFVL